MFEAARRTAASAASLQGIWPQTFLCWPV